VTLRCGEKWQSPPSQPTADPAYLRRMSLLRYSILALAGNREPTRTDMSEDVVRGELAGRLCGGKLENSPPNAAEEAKATRRSLAAARQQLVANPPRIWIMRARPSA